MANRERVVKIILYIMLTITVIPVLAATAYGMPSADDWGIIDTYRSYTGGPIHYLIWRVTANYLHWQGAYAGNLLGSFFPLWYKKFGLVGLRAEMLLTILLFLSSVTAVVVVLMKRIGIKKKDIQMVSLLMLAVLLFYILGTNNLDEVFYWHAGFGVYTWAIAFSFLSFMCFINYELAKRNNIYFVFGILFAVLGAGGALDVSAFLCAMMLFAVGYDIVVLKKIRKNAVIALTAFLGAIINTVAPGNFVRHSFIDTEIRPLLSIWNTLVRISSVISSDFTAGFLLLIFIVAFFIAYRKLGDSTFEFKYPGWVSLYCLFAVFITDFPVALGYSSMNLPSRCMFAERTAVAFFTALLGIYWGGWVVKKKFYHFTKEWYLIVVCICIMPLAGYFDLNKLLELTPYKMIYHMVTGDFNAAADRAQSVLDQIEASSEKDVIVSVPKPPEGEWVNIKTDSVTENVKDSRNAVIANAFGKNTVVLQYTDQ